MSMVRAGQCEEVTSNGLPLEQAEPCMFCEEGVTFGALWFGDRRRHAVCSSCVSAGQLGKLIGDALSRYDGIESALAKTEAQAYRARVRAHERNA